MKRLITVILTITVFMFSFCLSVSAKEKTKISDTLQNVMTEIEDNTKLDVHIWLYCHIDEDEVFLQAIKECGYVGGLPLNMTMEEVNVYRATYNRIVSEQEAAVSNAFVEKIGLVEDDIVYLGKHPYVILKLTKDRIYEAEKYKEVKLIDYANNAPDEAPTDNTVSNQTGQSGNVKLYEDKVKKIRPFLYNYKELYYHIDSESIVDWVLITGDEATIIPQPLYSIIGNRVVIKSQMTAPFGIGYAVYDTKQNIVKGVNSGTLDLYDGLEEAFNEYGCGKLIGDIDSDNEVTIVDATIMQRCDCHMREYPEDDLIQPIGEVENALKYYSDMNRDGERNILDVTCIQRFLVGLPYPRTK